MEKHNPLSLAHGCSHFGNSMAVPHSTKQLSSDLEIPCLGTDPGEMEMYVHTIPCHSSIIRRKELNVHELMNG